MKKKVCIIAFILIGVVLLSIYAIFVYFSQEDTAKVNNNYSAYALHTDRNRYITYAIRKELEPQSRWEYVVPMWYARAFYSEFFWCNDSYDFFILSSDVGAHLYVYDETSETWCGGYYIENYEQDGVEKLFYWQGNQPIAPYPEERIPIEIKEYYCE